MIEQSEHFVRLTTLGDEDRNVEFAYDPEIPVHAVRGVEERRGGSGRGERSRDLAADEARLADSGHDDTSFRLGNAFDRAREILTDAALCLAERFGLHAENSSSALDDVLVSHRWMRAQMSTARSSSESISARGTMLGPSLGAQSGSGCVSRKSP